MAEAQSLPTLLRNLVSASKFQVALQASETRVPLGRDIQVTFESSKPGYVHLIAVEPQGVVTLLFPNPMQPEHQVPAQRLMRIPQDVGQFHFMAEPPVGQSRVIALVTPTPLRFAAQRPGGPRTQGHAVPRGVGCRPTLYAITCSRSAQAPGGAACRSVSRRSVSINRMASHRFCRHASTVSPSPTAGISRQ